MSDITTSSSFPEAAGTAALAASVYRLAVLAPETFATAKYIGAADAWRKAVVKMVSSSGQLAPVVNPYSYTQNTAYDGPSPEAQDFAVLLYAAYRDCICAEKCAANLKSLFEKILNMCQCAMEYRTVVAFDGWHLARFNFT